jgi:hypothetical protein
MRAYEAAGLEPSQLQLRRDWVTKREWKKRRVMVTGGDLGAKAPMGDAPRLDPTMPYISRHSWWPPPTVIEDFNEEDK